MEKIIGVDPGLTTGVAEVMYYPTKKGVAVVHKVYLHEVTEVDAVQDILRDDSRVPTNSVWVEASPVVISNAKAVVQSVEAGVAAIVTASKVRPAEWKPNKRVAQVIDVIAPGLKKSHGRDALGIAVYGMLEEGWRRVGLLTS